MDDPLERFVKENRSSFDDLLPSEIVWGRIDQKMDKKSSFFRLMWKVAAVLFMISTLYLIIDRNTNSQNDELIFSEEFTEAESYYVTLIDQKKQEIKDQMTAKQRETFLDEVDQLDAMYLELKKTYQTNSVNNRVIDAMINNLQLRLKILDKQLVILSKIKDHNDEKDTSIEI